MRVNEPLLEVSAGEKEPPPFSPSKHTGSQCRLTEENERSVSQCPTSVHALGHANNGNPIISLQQAGNAVYTH